MEEKQPQTNQPLIADNPDAPEIFVSGALRADIEPGGLMKLTFATFRSDPSGGPVKQVVNVRIVMTQASGQNMCMFLDQWFRSLQTPVPQTVQ